MPKLLITVTARDKVLEQHAFEGRSVMVGRSDACNVILDNQGVSRLHTEISLEDGVYYLNDLGSANGTSLNGAPQVRAELHNGDILQISKFRLHIAIHAESDVKRPRDGEIYARDRTIKTSYDKKPV